MHRQRSGSLLIISLLLLTVLILTAAWVYTGWRSSLTVLPAGLAINGQDMSGMTREQALTTIQTDYTVPITVTYAGAVLPPLLPEMVELSLDLGATSENLDEALAGQAELQAFIVYIRNTLQGTAVEAPKVNAVVNYSRERVDAFLLRTAQQYDQDPKAIVPLPDAGTFRPAEAGTTLDIDASLAPLIQAILAADPKDRQVDLAVIVEPAPSASTAVLEQAITASLDGFTGIPGIYAKDLSTGQELCINCDVAFAGLSTVKIPIALKLYQHLDDIPTASVNSRIEAMLTQSDNAAANLILQEIGNTNPYSGALETTDFLQSLGLVNSFVAAPFDLKEGLESPNIVTPANSRTDFNTNPDEFVQTTPLDMGILLEGIYQCAYGGGFLQVLYPETITPAECESLLVWMTRNQENRMLGGALPAEARIAHKHGWRDDTHADVGIIFGEQTDIVLVVFLYQSETEWFVWEASVPTFNRIGLLVYRFYNGD